jgi:hypothetical protein
MTTHAAGTFAIALKEMERYSGHKPVNGRQNAMVLSPAA